MREFLIYLAIGFGMMLFSGIVWAIVDIFSIKAFIKSNNGNYGLDTIEIIRYKAAIDNMTTIPKGKRWCKTRLILFWIMEIVLWPVYIIHENVEMFMYKKDFNKRLKQL